MIAARASAMGVGPSNNIILVIIIILLVTIIIMELRSQWQSLVALHRLSDIDPGEKNAIVRICWVIFMGMY